MRCLFCFIITLFCLRSAGQNVSQRLDLAMQKLISDSQFKHALISLYVVESKTGQVVYDKNSETGLAPASCLKVVTSVSAFEMLGRQYTFKTQLSYDGTIDKNTLRGSVFLQGSGDPTLGSWRYKSTGEELLLKTFRDAIYKAGIKRIDGAISIIDTWGPQVIPDGWIWQDIGNYYGAGCWSLNWRENQYDLVLKSGNRIGDPVSIVSIIPSYHKFSFINLITSARRGTGDNAYIFLAPKAVTGYLTGTIPINEDRFVISGSMPDPPAELSAALFDWTFPDQQNKVRQNSSSTQIPLYTHVSPPLDSINFWFLNKSVNLYGEAFVKTIGRVKVNSPTTDSGIHVIRKFWRGKGIESSALKIVDGSGLSPENRITTKALVTVMQYAKKQSWFPSFHRGLPELNGMKMKSGYISGVQSYTGYSKARNGMEYTFSIIVNNYDGSTAAVKSKLWKVLDILK